MSLRYCSNERVELPHDEQHFLWTTTMLFVVQRMAFPFLVLMSDFRYGTEALPNQSSRVEDGIK